MPTIPVANQPGQYPVLLASRSLRKSRLFLLFVVSLWMGTNLHNELRACTRVASRIFVQALTTC